MTEPERILTVPRGPDGTLRPWPRFAVELPAAQASVTIPIEVPPGRNGLVPSLNLTYGSVCGPGPLGVGWTLPLETVRRMGERYFLDRPAGGGGELVALGGGRFRPRSDDKFARLEFADNKWRIRDRGGQVHQLGEIAPGRWSLERTTDTFGHRVEYRWESGQLAEVRWLEHGRGPQVGFLASVLFEHEGKRCARIRVRGHAGETTPIRTYHLEHEEAQNGWLLLKEVRVEGHDGARSESSGPIRFRHAPFDPSLRRFVALSPAELAALRPVDKPEVVGRERPPADFPKIGLDDARVHRVDLSGDGRPDLVIVRDRSIVYWPKLADGGWGPPVRMENSPELPDFDPARVFLGDVDGDGLADLVYVGNGDVRLFINHGGRGWSFAAHIRGTPKGEVSLVALAGGMAGILWRGERSRHWLLDLTGGARPYLLRKIEDPIEGATEISWAPFSSGLPRPVQVVTRVNRDSHTASYVYEGPIWRGGFRGFSKVERRDSDGSVCRTWFGRDGKSAGRPIKLEIRQPDGNLSLREWTWGAPAADSVYGVALTGERQGSRHHFYWDHDGFGQPRADLEVGLDEATLTLTQYAGREEPQLYLVDRPARITRYSLELDGFNDAESFRREVASGSRTRRILADTLHHYDGQPFVGLPLGQIGKHGMRMRTERLAFTGEWLERTLPAAPPWLLQSRPEWTDEYPRGFRTALPALGGYARHPITSEGRELDAWYVVASRRRYDFQEAGAAARGRVTMLRDALEHDTAITYDGYELMAAKISDPRGLSTQAAWDYRVFRPKSVVAAGGGRMAFGYSPLGKLVRRALHARAGDERALRDLTYEYDARSIKTLCDGVLEKIEYRDAEGALLQERSAAAEIAFPPLPALETPEEVKGEKSERVIVRVPGAPPRESAGWEYQPSPIFSVDEKREGVRDLLGRDWSRGPLDAGGALVEERGALGALVLRAYDSAGREVRRWARDDKDQPVTLRVWKIYGDSIESGLPVQRASEANLLGRLHRQYDEAGLLVHHAYDVDGNLLERTRQPLAAEVVGKGPIDWQPLGNLSLEGHSRGLLDDKKLQTQLRWDARGRMIGMTHPEDLAGRRRQSSYAYDRAGRMIRCELDGKVIVEHAAYDASGRKLLVAWGNGILQRWSRDAEGRVVRLRAERAEKIGELQWKSGSALQEYWCERDAEGRITTLIDDSPDAGLANKPHRLQRSFGYDEDGRLTSATGRESGRAPEWPWEDTPRSAESVQMRAVSEGFDWSEGHLVRLRHDAGRGSFTREFVLDEHGRLERLKGPDGYLSYYLDEAGRLSVESSVRKFSWDHSGRLARYRWENEIDLVLRYHDGWVLKLLRLADGQLKMIVRDGGFVAGSEGSWLHLSAGDWRIASVRSEPQREELRCHLEDLEGSIGLVVDGEGNELGREGYNAFGETAWGGMVGQPFRFRAAERDPITGLYEIDGRPYAPWLARTIDDGKTPGEPNKTVVAAQKTSKHEWLAETFRVPAIEDRGIEHGERELQDPGPRHRPEPQGSAGAARRGVGQGADLR